MKKAIIIQNKFIGDVLMASMIARNLKEIYPNIQVHFFCFEPAKSIIENHPSIDKIIAFDDNELKKFSVLWQYVKQIRREKYDILIDSYAKLQSRFITLFSGAKYKVSYDKPFFKRFYTHVYPKHVVGKSSAMCTAVDDRVMLLSPFIKDFTKLKHLKPEIFLTNEERQSAKQMLLNAGITLTKPLIVVGVLGSEKDKTWPIVYMTKLIKHLTTNYDFDIIFNYNPKQQEEVDDLLTQLNQKTNIYTNVLGKTVREFAAILSWSNCIIGNEGGAINTAKALKIPSFAIFSPHKFRENWGCYENEKKYKSVHLEDFEPATIIKTPLKELLKNPEPYYKKLTPDKVIPLVDEFIEANISSQNNIEKNITTHNNNLPKISALLVTKNEERNIPYFLNDFEFCDEIIIVDSKSTDKTKEIALKHPKVKFIERAFDNFSSQKNFAITQAANEWVLFFDADERLTRELKHEILETVKNPNAKDAYFIYRQFFFQNKPMKYSGWQNDKAIRLFKKSLNQYDTNKFVHETIICNGTVGGLTNKLLHYSLESKQEYERKLSFYSMLRAEQLHKKGVQPNWFHHYIKPKFRFLHHYIFRYGFLDGKNGWTMAKMHGDSVKKRYQFLKELNAKNAQLNQSRSR